MLTSEQNNKPNLARHIVQTAHREGFDVFLHGGMSHLKAMLIDDAVLIVGSCNFDFMGHYLLEELLVMTRNRIMIEAFVEQVLVPALGPRDVVILDNLSSHKRVRTRELIEATGARLVFLPPYSPDLNPIELIFAKVKQLLRSLACRTRETLWAAMQSVLDQVSPDDAANCYTHCGYTLRLD